MNIFSLSHIDLDGYFCQYLIKKRHKDEVVEFYNSNYGPEIIKNLKKIIKKAKKEDLIYITDLMLSGKEFSFILDLVNKGFNIKVLDHHKNEGLEKRNYSWLKIDLSRSASGIVAEELNVSSKILNAVNSYDIWDIDGDIFTGSQLSEIVNKEPIFYTNEKRVNFFIDWFNFIEERDLNDIELLFNEFCKLRFDGFKSLKWELSKEYYADMKLEKTLGKYIVLFDLDREYFQYLSYYILNENGNLIVCNIQKNGRIAFRSRTENVSLLCQQYFNGGGHEGASGGYLGMPIQSKENGRDRLIEVLT